MRVSTFVDSQRLIDVLATIRTHWQRWSTSGFDAGEMNVARWLLTGQNAVAYSSGSSIASSRGVTSGRCISAGLVSLPNTTRR